MSTVTLRDATDDLEELDPDLDDDELDEDIDDEL